MAARLASARIRKKRMKERGSTTIDLLGKAWPLELDEELLELELEELDEAPALEEELLDEGSRVGSARSSAARK